MQMNSWQVESFGKPLVQALREVPAPAGTEVVLRIASCGVCTATCTCTTATSTWAAGTGSTWRARCSRRAPWATRSRALVAAVGPEAQGVQVGDRARRLSLDRLRACALCAAGQEHLCSTPRALGVARDGGFATHVVVPHPRYLVDHGAIPDEQACTWLAPD